MTYAVFSQDGTDSYCVFHVMPESTDPEMSARRMGVVSLVNKKLAYLIDLGSIILSKNPDSQYKLTLPRISQQKKALSQLTSQMYGGAIRSNPWLKEYATLANTRLLYGELFNARIE